MGQSSSSTTEPDKEQASTDQNATLRRETAQRAPVQRPAPIICGVSESEMQKLALTDEIGTLITDNLPMSCKGSNLGFPVKWYLLYSSDINGKSFQRLVQHIVSRGPTVLIVKLKNSARVIGAFCESDWLTVAEREKAAKSAAAASARALREGQAQRRKVESKSKNTVFFGNANCFVFRVHSSNNDGVSEMGEIYKSKPSMNTNFMYLFDVHPLEDKVGIGMGGQSGYYGWFIDRWLETGTCYGSRCTTFDCPRLTPTETWQVDSVEVYAVKSDVVEQLLRDGNQLVTDVSCVNGNQDSKAAQLILELNGTHQFNRNERPDC
ncbi:hypothetical protein ABB37_05127 [Leptomonas pyrrhocoris]|uniref:TLDc domain-containing protein n=1 Tax=Leptomonas pyrrhocoris TaxID=157538 RepID=A0A0M9G197_LEPPY|nr:hypothetical protein ABB37_05127 [Leptomonas pyrrhocoris]KPA80137.1 hypothetical protein ABB37_05127 [Leptomonas pyrrhocoris]|eukprot:XP_015658576.1 hypothetical protein ABB37_05127 [Leptomonas pyrrhocoris]